jgi:hypothetical protein
MAQHFAGRALPSPLLLYEKMYGQAAVAFRIS